MPTSTRRSSDRAGNLDIFAMNADGAGLVNLTNDPAEDGLPAWSSDGEKIAFTSDRAAKYEIYIMHIDGSGVERLTDNAAVDLGPAWSRDGKRIAFISSREGTTRYTS